MLYSFMLTLLLFIQHGYAQGLGRSCYAGWAVKQRRSTDSKGWTMVSPDKKFVCSGELTAWRYQGKRSNPFRAIVWRPVEGSKTQFKIIGINDIPAGEVNKPVTYIVPEDQRIQVEAGDVIGWSFGAPVLAYNGGGLFKVRWVRGNLHAQLDVGQTRDIDGGVQKRAYSIEAEVHSLPVPDPCASNPCPPGHECIPSSDNTDFECLSAQIEDPCASNPCPIGHGCEPTNDNTDFVCHKGSAAMVNKMIARRKCMMASNDCNDHGTCEDVSNTGDYSCVCEVGWMGIACGFPVEESGIGAKFRLVAQIFKCIEATNDCNDHGTCEDFSNTGNYSCVCQDSWMGVACSIPVEDSENLDMAKQMIAIRKCLRTTNDCSDHGTCEDVSNTGDYSCVCQDGWTGIACNILPKIRFQDQAQLITWIQLTEAKRDGLMKCLSDTHTCSGHGTCEDRIGRGDYSCICEDDWKGPLCNEPAGVSRSLEKVELMQLAEDKRDGLMKCLIDTHGCSGHGTCEDRIGRGDYSCICEDDWNGLLCNKPAGVSRSLELLLRAYLKERH